MTLQRKHVALCHGVPHLDRSVPTSGGNPFPVTNTLHADHQIRMPIQAPRLFARTSAPHFKTTVSLLVTPTVHTPTNKRFPIGPKSCAQHTVPLSFNA